MSKSKGEFLTVSLLEEKGYDPLAYRWFCLQSHYRKALVFTWDNLDQIAKRGQQVRVEYRTIAADSPLPEQCAAVLICFAVCYFFCKK